MQPVIPACSPAALLQKVVPGPDPLKERSSRVEPLVVRLGAVNLHLINRQHCYSPFAPGHLDNICGNIFTPHYLKSYLGKA